jgi:hypothetical protein
MRESRIAVALVGAAAPLILVANVAIGQLGLYTLPQDDFRWNWGAIGPDDGRRGMADIQVSGSESVFRCELSARTRPSSALGPTDYRQLENDLRTRLDFIFAVSEAMNYLDQTRNLDWAVLDCKRPEEQPVDAATSEKRQNDAREKMLRELERRRAKQRSED